MISQPFGLSTSRKVSKYMSPAPKFSPREQEEMILNAAVECITETSLLDFTMSSIAKGAGLSMGSIYKHVQCKEDIIFALAARVFTKHCETFEKILALPITTPEKIIAITLINPKKVELYPFDNHLESFSVNELIISRASEKWADRMVKANEACEEVFYNCMKSAAQSGELTLEGDTDQMIEEINLGSWALCVGFQNIHRVIEVRNIAAGTDTLHEPIATDANNVRSLQRLLNSYTWQQPLTSEGVERVAKMLIDNGLR